eukprot:gnl/Spiro4/25167_TR12521_c0_g1_i1.p1 gnl/Spiro4/25167_TR12521_c0_g1~~gnl/Spiro4/25167_TR12521_c0_g1_i1.p1  ORF type:complete len:285 (-),score=53.23 gnl/Spiro4/25167_TR12521_c0_g1_i1:78-932(-)
MPHLLPDADEDAPLSGFWKKLRFDDYNVVYAGLCLALTCTFAITILVKTATLPSLVWCSNPATCDIPSSRNVDIGFLVMGCVAYSLILFLALCLVFCPGSAMDHPLRVKVIAFISIVIIVWSLMQLIGVMVNRGRVINYSDIQAYSIQVATVGTSVVMRVSNYWSTVYSNLLGSAKVALCVFPLSSQKALQDISPVSATLYCESDLSSDPDTTASFARNQTVAPVSSFSTGTWYLWAVFPQGVGARPLYSVSSVTTTAGLSLAGDLYVDLRGYIICKWTGSACV